MTQSNVFYLFQHTLAPSAQDFSLKTKMNNLINARVHTTIFKFKRQKMCKIIVWSSLVERSLSTKHFARKDDAFIC